MLILDREASLSRKFCKFWQNGQEPVRTRTVQNAHIARSKSGQRIFDRLKLLIEVDDFSVFSVLPFGRSKGSAVMISGRFLYFWTRREKILDSPDNFWKHLTLRPGSIPDKNRKKTL
jgi:hypothetical protein